MSKINNANTAEGKYSEDPVYIDHKKLGEFNHKILLAFMSSGFSRSEAMDFVKIEYAKYIEGIVAIPEEETNI